MDQTKFDAQLLNTALELATEWGVNMLKPIHDRIRVDRPLLTDGDIDELTAIARAAESRAYSLAVEEMNGSIDQREVVFQMMREYPWMTEQNATGLANNAGYNARR